MELWTKEYVYCTYGHYFQPLVSFCDAFPFLQQMLINVNGMRLGLFKDNGLDIQGYNDYYKLAEFPFIFGAAVCG